MSFVMNWIYENVWGITAPALEAICKIAERESEFSGKSSDQISSEIFHRSALSVKGEEPIAGTRYSYMRGNVGVLRVMGPIFPRANMMTELSGAASLQMLSTDFTKLLDNQDVAAILLELDTPGGAITGVSEFAEYIASSRGVKPIWAYVTGSGASAGYWIASAAEKLIIADTGAVGSIGVVATYRDTQKKDENEGVRNMEIVSSQSPMKRVRPDTDEGRLKIQRMVDASAAVFVEKVAQYRGTDEETVLEEFGRGDMFVGVRALAQGLVDEVATFEDTVAELTKLKNKNTKRKEHTMNEKQNANADAVVTYTVEGVREGSPETFAAILAMGKKDGADAERKRILDIQSMTVPGCEKLVAEAVANSEMTAEKLAVTILKQQNEQRSAAAKANEEAARQLAEQSGNIVGTPAPGAAEQKAAEQKAAVEAMARGGSNARKARG